MSNAEFWRRWRAGDVDEEMEVELRVRRAESALRAARTPSRGYVYLIQGEGGGPIKVGYAKDPEKRLAVLQPGSPVKLQLVDFVLSPERAFDLQIHAALPAEHRSHGEWFHPTERVLQVLDRLGFDVSSLRERTEGEGETG